ncbi:MAG TPA: phosphonate ABC transporter, permease protein PhnE [Trueperaceae bacterium]
MATRERLAAVPPLPPHARRSLVTQYLIVAGILGLTILCLLTLNLPSWERVSRGLANNVVRVLQSFVNPHLETAPLAMSAMAETFFMAVIGTTIGAILAFPVSFLAAANLMGGTLPSAPGKTLLVAIRTFPEIVLAVIFVVAAGPGPTAGIMAMGIHSIGFLGKIFADVIESIDPGPSEAIRATGGTPLHVFFYSVVPQVLPEFASTALYRFEINLRAATVLGLVGAGGIGLPLIQRIQFRRWEQVSMILIVIVVVIIVVDAVSARIRRRLV